MQKIDLSKYQIKVSTELPKREIKPFQRYALEVCEMFKLTGGYRMMIFKYCKKSESYVRGKVENTKEKFGTEKLYLRANYFISLFRAKKPWEK